MDQLSALDKSQAMASPLEDTKNLNKTDDEKDNIKSNRTNDDEPIDIGNALTEMAKPLGEGVRQPNGTILAEPLMDVHHVATSVLHMAQLPLDTNVLFMNVMARDMPFVGRG